MGEHFGAGPRKARAKRTCDMEIPEKLVEEFDPLGVSPEQFEEWEDKEIQAESLPELPVYGIGEASQAVMLVLMLRFMNKLLSALGEQPGACFKAQRILEIYMRKAKPDFQVLPAACAAIVGLVRKFNCDTMVPPAHLAVEASQLVKWLLQAGIETVFAVTAEQIKEQEMLVLAALDWDLAVPDMHNWLRATLERFLGLTQGRGEESFQWVFKRCVHEAMQIGMSGTDLALSPRVLANGSFCLNLVAAGLLTLDDLRPDTVDDPLEWERIFVASRLQKGANGATTKSSPHSKSMLAALKLATGCTTEMLKDDAHLTALAFGTVVMHVSV